MTQSTPPQVVVACAWYNRADYIRGTVDSLLAQDFDSYEVVIVNDGSSDPRVREILDSYDDPRLQVIHQENIGFVGAIRRAISLSSSPLIAIQGAGDVSYPRRIRMQAEFLQENNDIAGVGVGVKNINFGGVKDGFSRVINNEAGLFSKADFMTDKNPFTHGEVMFRREVYDVVDGYRSVFKFSQDRDLWLRMVEHKNFARIPEVLYERRSFSSDGVSGDTAKAIVQKKLSYFARQCAEEREIFGFDSVDVFQEKSIIFARKRSEVANSFAKTAIKYYGKGDSSSARFVSKMALNEKLTLMSVASWFLSSLKRDGFLGGILIKIIIKKDKNDNRYYRKLGKE